MNVLSTLGVFLLGNVLVVFGLLGRRRLTKETAVRAIPGLEEHADVLVVQVEGLEALLNELLGLLALLLLQVDHHRLVLERRVVLLRQRRRYCRLQLIVLLVRALLASILCVVVVRFRLLLIV